MTITAALIAGALMMIGSSRAFSQRMLVAAGGGYEFGHGMNHVKALAPPSPSPIERDRNYHHRGWAGIGLLSSDIIARNLGLDLWLNFAYTSRRLTGTIDYGSVIIPSGDTAIMVNYVAGFDSRLWTTALQLDLRGRLRLIGPLHLESGVVLGYRLGSGFLQTASLVEPERATFADGSRKLVLQDGSSLTTTTRLGITAMAGFAYDIPLEGVVGIRPAILLQAGLSDIPDADPTMLALRLGLYFNSNPEKSR